VDESLRTQKEAVALILEKLREEGLYWYNSSAEEGFDPISKYGNGNYSFSEIDDLARLSKISCSSLPSRKIVVLPPPKGEDDPLLGLWLKWNFDKNPFEFRIFMGFWYKKNSSKNFICFRFETPEKGINHDYYHCQVCKDFGDSGVVSEAVCVPKFFPTIPVKATNIVELIICVVMAIRGRKNTKSFIKKILIEPVSLDNQWLKKAFLSI